MLLLKKHLIELVRAGRKTQTIRLWKRPMVRENQRAYAPGLGRLLILSVEKIKSLSQLTRGDALADGFASLAALRRELRAIYGAARDKTKSLYRVRFHWPAPPDFQKIRAKKSAPKKSPAKPPAEKKPPTKPQMRHALAALLRKRAG
jgi:hypothetical protein